jgi:hypothetical protein
MKKQFVAPALREEDSLSRLTLRRIVSGDLGDGIGG